MDTDTAPLAVATIEVGVYGGLVQWVRGIPGDLELRVYDYDIDGVDTGVVSSDTDGNPCVTVIYRGSGNE